MTVALTDQQNAILRFVVEFWGANMMPPSIREICAHMGFSSPNGATCHLRALAAKGAIVWNPHKGKASTKSRNIIVPKLLEAARAAADALLKEREHGT